MTRALYRKYRSRSLDDIVGQSHVTELLSKALKQDRVAHAYLFTGPRGVGKTSIARILAHEINGIEYTGESQQLDIIEIDAASNNGVEDIRDLRDKVQIAPVNAKKKVYIIDEAHMLSKPAFNALLKTLEEPPEHVVFILATTDIDKVPDTIISRTQRHTFRRASINDLVANLQRIAKAEAVKTEKSALELIAHHSDGSFRDSVSLFDQICSMADKEDGVTKQLVVQSLGLANDATINELLDATIHGNLEQIATKLEEMQAAGTPVRTIVNQLISALQPRLVADGDLLHLLDRLLDITKSSNPDLKLLTTLGLYAAPSPKATVESNPIAEKKPTATPPLTKERAVTKEQVATKHEPVIEKPIILADSPINTVFDWQKFITHIKENYIAVHSVVSKCESEVSDKVIILYTKNQFYKKKLDDSRYRQLLNTALEAIGAAGYEIETIATSAPLKDSQAAKIAAIMGGGEEVSLEDAS